MSLKAVVFDEVSYILEKDTNDTFDEETGVIVLYTSYRPEEDEDGYNPPKGLFEGTLEEMIEDSFPDFKSNTWKRAKNIQYDEAEIQTIYVSKKEITDTLTMKQLEALRMSKITVQLNKKTKKNRSDTN